jgi:phosphohistidine swiveling domain-containing protein
MDKEAKKKIPRFRSREEEAEFWDTHSPLDFPDEIRQVEMRVRKPLKGVLAIRLDHKHLEELRELAEQYGVGPTTLARMFIVSSLNACKESGSMGILSPPKPELKADLYGSPANPGVVEGLARVILSEDHLSELQPGEILVAPATMPSWAPVFGKIEGVITDSREMLSNAVTVGRAYGIPAVVGTMEATKKIKTGQRIRIDGDHGRVYILE